MAQIKLRYQVPHREYGLGNSCRTTYEVRTLLHTVDPGKPFRENLDDAFSLACERGADPNKNIMWNVIKTN